MFPLLFTQYEPQTYEEAIGKPAWEEAMKKEFEVLKANQTWVLTSLPKGKKPISCTWIYKIKHKANGSVEKYKVRLVVKGFSQKKGIDYSETLSPIVKMTVVRSLIVVTIKN